MKTKISIVALLLLFGVAFSAQAEIKKFTFGVMGDSEEYNPSSTTGNINKSLTKMSKAKAKLVVGVGDINTSCDGDETCKTRFTNWRDLVKTKFSKFYLSMGEKDRTDSDADDTWKEVFDFPTNADSSDGEELYYSFDYGNSHFVVLNTESPDEHSIDSDQREWLEEDLNDNDKDNTFVFMHEPAWPTNSKVGKSLDENQTERDRVWNIFSDYKVSAVFSGHEHLYSRKKVTVDLLPGVKNEVYQIIVGNLDSNGVAKTPNAGMSDYYSKKEGYVLVDVNKKKVTVRSYTVKGKLLNKFSFNSK